MFTNWLQKRVIQELDRTGGKHDSTSSGSYYSNEDGDEDALNRSSSASAACTSGVLNMEDASWSPQPSHRPRGPHQQILQHASSRCPSSTSHGCSSGSTAGTLLDDSIHDLLRQEHVGSYVEHVKGGKRKSAIFKHHSSGRNAFLSCREVDRVTVRHVSRRKSSCTSPSIRKCKSANGSSSSTRQKATTSNARRSSIIATTSSHSHVGVSRRASSSCSGHRHSHSSSYSETRKSSTVIFTNQEDQDDADDDEPAAGMIRGSRAGQGQASPPAHKQGRRSSILKTSRRQTQSNNAPHSSGTPPMRSSVRGTTEDSCSTAPVEVELAMIGGSSSMNKNSSLLVVHDEKENFMRKRLRQQTREKHPEHQMDMEFKITEMENSDMSQVQVCRLTTATTRSSLRTHSTGFVSPDEDLPVVAKPLSHSSRSSQQRDDVDPIAISLDNVNIGKMLVSSTAVEHQEHDQSSTQKDTSSDGATRRHTQTSTAQSPSIMLSTSDIQMKTTVDENVIATHNSTNTSHDSSSQLSSTLSISTTRTSSSVILDNYGASLSPPHLRGGGTQRSSRLPKRSSFAGAGGRPRSKPGRVSFATPPTRSEQEEENQRMF
ncbi:unnamed protein product [Amoebophrya sp. A25]|nr:unnamed protein product [Amoebophrya sp. A25]|eukprot:GSA25T00025419001.1